MISQAEYKLRSNIEEHVRMIGCLSWILQKALIAAVIADDHGELSESTIQDKYISGSEEILGLIDYHGKKIVDLVHRDITDGDA